MRALLFLLLAAGCFHTAPGGSGEPDVVRGTVQSVDMSPMAYDGNGLVTIEASDGATFIVEIPARAGLCQAEGLALGTELQAGDSIEVLGEIENAHIRLCTDPTHFLRRTR